MRSMAATQAAQVARVHWPGSVISGWASSSHRPALAINVRMMARTLGVSVEVSYQRWTQAAQDGWVPSMRGAWLWPGRTGASQCPRSATTFCSAYSAGKWWAQVAGCACTAANAALAGVGQPGAAVEQQRLAQDAGQPVAAVVVGLAAGAPPLHHRTRLAHRGLHGLGDR